MAQRQFRSDDTDKWLYGFGDGSLGNGSINTSTDAPIDSACSGTATQTSLTATNASFAAGQLIMIHQTRGTGVGVWELNKIQSYNAGTITLTHAMMNTYTNSGASVAQVLVMKQYNDLTINNAQTLTAKAWNETVGGIIAYFVKGTLTVTGNISTSSTGFRGGAANTSNAQAGSGEGTAGASANQSTANGNGGGGGNQKPGAGGGNGAAGTTRDSSIGGSAVGTASLVTMDFGGGGGGGSGDGGDSAGGIGAGIVLLIAKNIATITGTIVNTGGNSAAAPAGRSGGGAAGGSVLLKCVTAVLGTNKVTAAAGTAGAGIDGNATGGDGAVGRIHIDYGTSYTGTTSPAIDATNDITLNPAAGWIPFFI